MVSGPRRITILGSTGSIGDSTIDLIERDAAAYDVVALTANSNWAKLAEQARRLKPAIVAVADPGAYADLKEPEKCAAYLRVDTRVRVFPERPHDGVNV